MSRQTISKHNWTDYLETIRLSLTNDRFLYLVFTAGCVGIFYAKALVSIFSGMIFGVALLNILIHRNALKELGQYRSFVALMAIVLVYVFSGMHSDDLGRWGKLTWESIPYAAIPIGFYAYRNSNGSTWRRLLFIYIGVATLSALSVMIDYAMHFESYNALYKIGKTIPTPIIHVRYSFFMALAACMAFALAYDGKRQTVNGKRQTTVSLFLGIFLAIVVHVLAVRTGLLALYGGLFVMMAFLVLRDGRWKLGIATALSVFFLIVIAYNAFPSVANKIGYVMYDLQMLKDQGALAEYSDNVRITSIRHGLDLLKDNLITGTGIGDLKAEMNRMYSEKTPNFPEESWFPPISQYILIVTAFGIVGAAVIFFLLLYPLFHTPLNYVLLAIYSTMLFGSIGETTIELLLGKTVFVSLVCIAVLYARQIHRSDDVAPSTKSHSSTAL